MTQTMAYSRCGDAFVVLVHSARTPTDGEWERYLVDLRSWQPEVRGVLVVSDGAGPTGGQRRAMHHEFRHGHRILTAVISESLLARGVVLAMNLWNPAIRGFRPEAIDKGLDYIRVPHGERASLVAEVARLRERLRV